MNCDLIAPFYRFFETLTFGNLLQKHRIIYLNAAANAARVLVLGDGDGRFLEVLCSAYPDLEIDVVELSHRMISEAARRVHSKNVQLVQGDALTHLFAHADYGAIYSHFFLDCFDTVTVRKLIRKIGQHTTPDAVWVISDFRQLRRGWPKWWSRLLLRVMYLFFRMVSGLTNQRLPDHVAAMREHGFEQQEEHLSLGGFIASEYWRRKPARILGEVPDADSGI